METCVRVPASSSNYHEKEDDSNEPRRFHRHVQGRHSAKGGGVLPAPLPALGERRHAPQAAPKAPGSAGRRHQGRGPLPQGTPGHHRRRRDGHRQDLHWRGGGAHGGIPAHPHHLPAPPGAQVEAGGGDDGARRPRRHRRVHHRPGAAAPLRRLRPPVRGDEPGEGQVVLPLDARRHTAVGHVQGQAHTGGGDGRALPHPLLPRLHGADRGQGRRAPDGRRPEPPQAHLRRLRRSPLAGRQVRAGPLPACGLHQAQDEGLLRPADRRRGP